MKPSPGRLIQWPQRPASHDFICSWYRPPAWASGFISPHDARFLYDLLDEFQPRNMIEIGVASGVSTVLLLDAMEMLNLDARLYSFDIADHFYAKPELRLGQYVYERFGGPPPRLSLNPGISSMNVASCLRDIGGRNADFTFIDANHYHPWPCLDLLAILGVVAPGSWVVLHDINLPNLAPEFPCYGPLRLFTCWSGERRVAIDPDRQSNIGAIRLFDTVAENVDAILSAMEVPWDIQIDYPKFQQLYSMLRPLGGGRASRLRSIHFRNMAWADRRRYVMENSKDVLRPWLGRPVRTPA